MWSREKEESSLFEVEGGYGYQVEGEEVLSGVSDVPLSEQLGLNEETPKKSLTLSFNAFVTPCLP